MIDGNMKILLINPPVRHYMFPLGLGYIASCLREEGHDVNVLDIDGCRYPKEVVERKLKNHDFEAVGISGMITTYPYVKWLASIIKKEHSVPIVVGGTGGTSYPQLYLENTEADVVVIGEGESTSKELFDAIENSRNLKDVAGIWYKEDGKILQTPLRELIENLDIVPYPAWELFPTEWYVTRGVWAAEAEARRQMSILTTRGCPYQCAFCYHCFQGLKTRFRSPENVIGEIKELIEKYRTKFFNFADDLFVLNKGRVLDICKKIKEENLDIKWSATGRVNLVDRELLQAMASAGCVFIGYGIESGGQLILNNMNKQATVEQAKRAIRLTREAGIYPDCSFMIGFPGETRETIRETVNFIKEMDLSLEGGFFFTTPYPGTLLWKYAKEKGLIPDDEALISNYGEMSQKLLVNFTNFTNEELIAIKNRAEKEVYTNYFQHHPREVLIKNIKSALRYYQRYGLRKTIAVARRSLLGYV